MGVVVGGEVGVAIRIKLGVVSGFINEHPLFV